MKVGQHCKRRVVCINGAADIVAAARMMRDEHVGFLIVHEQGDDIRKPIGVVTDRDLVLEVMAQEVDPHAVTVKDVMTRQPLIASEGDELAEALQAMRMAGIRRVPVTDGRGALTGIFALDDGIDLITGLLCDISGSIKSEQRQEWRARAN
jgi:CBS domain-containing protein